MNITWSVEINKECVLHGKEIYAYHMLQKQFQ